MPYTIQITQDRWDHEIISPSGSPIGKRGEYKDLCSELDRLNSVRRESVAASIIGSIPLDTDDGLAAKRALERADALISAMDEEESKRMSEI